MIKIVKIQPQMPESAGDIDILAVFYMSNADAIIIMLYYHHSHSSHFEKYCGEVTSTSQKVSKLKVHGGLVSLYMYNSLCP